MPYENLYNLKTNPFRMTPAVSSEEIFWAGFPLIKQQFENRIKRSMKIPNSSLILNWGEYGSGKTHAARFFGKTKTLSSLAEASDTKIPFFVFITLPKGKNPIQDFYISIIDKIDISNLRGLFKDYIPELNNHISTIEQNIHIKAVLEAIFNETVPINDIKRYLYQTSTPSENSSLIKFEILRPLNSDFDFSKVLSGIFSCLTYAKKVFSSIILWIDEFEDIAIMTKVNGDKTNSFLRELLDNTPNNLLIFLNLTQSALFNIQDLGEYISDAVRSRIRHRINFEIPRPEDILLYVKELLGYYRENPLDLNKNNLFPYNDALINQITNDLKNPSLRVINEALGMLLDIGELEDETPLTLDLYDRNRSDIVGDWKS